MVNSHCYCFLAFKEIFGCIVFFLGGEGVVKVSVFEVFFVFFF